MPASIPTCGICSNSASNSRKLYCAACATAPSLGLRIRLVNSLTEVASLTNQIEDVLGGDFIYDRVVQPNPHSLAPLEKSLAARNYTGLLDTKIQNMHNHLERLKQARVKCQKETALLNCKCQQLRSQNKARAQQIADRKASIYQTYGKAATDVAAATSAALVSSNSTFIPRIKELQDRHTHDLVVVFNIRRKRRKKDRGVVRPKVANGGEARSTVESNSPDPAHPDVLISFTVIPDLSILPHYSQPTINASIERLAVFVGLLAYYLDVRLPYEILPSNRHHAYVRISDPSRSTKHSLFLSNGVQSMAQQRPKEFEKTAEALAMLALNLTAISNRLDIPRTTAKDIAQLNITTALIYGKLVPGQDLDIGSLAPPVEKPSLETTDFASVVDYIVNQTYFEINGASGEWNIIDKVEESEGEVD